ncbi:MAG TPA: glycosyltransferase family 4 protein [Candidatus Paceibacterota bacterium]|nr:glycosyltransferase family 4 protein [Candidatus Paceibacterota bacterium]
MVAPLVESVPPQLYGGTERFVAWLVNALVAMGHDVTLFASGDSQTSARLHKCSPKNLRRMYEDLKEKPADYIAWQKQATHAMLQEVFKHVMNGEFDIVHLNVDDPEAFRLFSSKELPCPVVMTMHGRLDLEGLRAAYQEHPLPLVSISNDQRTHFKMSNANWAGTVYHGLPEDLYQLENETLGDYLLFIGRVSREKGLESAIRIAGEAHIPLKIIAKIDPTDREYYREKIHPLIFGNSNIEFVGEKNDQEKQKYLNRARALIFPINWPEPFGLVMIEAMATGRPVVAFGCGSVPEVLKHGETGFVVEKENYEDKIREAIHFVNACKNLSPQKIRKIFLRDFTAKKMAEGYVEIYQKLWQERRAGQKTQNLWMKKGKIV